MLVVLLLAALLGQQPAAPPALDYDFYKARVQPLFLEKRPEHARCVTCHAGSTTLRLQRLSPGAEAWNDAQTRQNFEAAVAMVVPGSPAASKLLRHPLARAAGGDVFHGGGQHWATKDDPDWQVLAAWVNGANLASHQRGTADPGCGGCADAGDHGQHPEWFTFSPDGKKVYVAAAGDNAVTVVDTATLKVLARVPVGQVPKRNATALLRQ